MAEIDARISVEREEFLIIFIRFSLWLYPYPSDVPTSIEKCIVDKKKFGMEVVPLTFAVQLEIGGSSAYRRKLTCFGKMSCSNNIEFCNRK